MEPDIPTLHSDHGHIHVQGVNTTTTLRGVVAATCLLSVVGSLLIISTYLFIKSLRSAARLVLVHLSVMDAGVATANLVGVLVDFNSYYNTGEYSWNGYPVPPSNISVAVNAACVTQAAFAVYFTFGSFMWTLGMAFYLYMRIVHYRRVQAKYVLYTITVLCYGLPLLPTLWKLVTNRLGYSPFSSEGWCGVKNINLESGQKYYLLHFISYDMWVYLIYIMVPVLYISAYLHIRQEVSSLYMLSLSPSLTHSTTHGASLFF